METIRELLIALGLDVDQAKFAEAIGLEHLLEKGAELAVDALKELAEALVETVKETAEFAHEVEDASERTGIAAEELQKLGYVAGLAGLQFSDVEISLNHLSRTMAAARDGNAEASATFAKLHTRVTNADGSLRSTTEVISDMAAGFQRLKTPADRTAAAMDTFGRAGGKMLNIIGKGPVAFRELMKEAEDFGTVMDEEAIQKGAELNKSFLRLGMIFASIKNDFAGPLIEELGPLLKQLLDWIRLNRELIRSKVVEWSRALVRGFRLLYGIAQAVSQAVAFVIDNLKFFALVAGGVLLAAIVANVGALGMFVLEVALAGAEAVAAAVEAAIAWAAAAAPVLLLAALFAALLLILDDVRGYLEGEDSLIGDIGPKWTKFLDDFSRPHTGDPWWLAALRKAVDFVTHLYETIPKLMDEIEGVVQKIDVGVLGKLDRAAHDAVVDLFSGGASGPEAAGALASGSRGAAGGDVNAHIEIHPPPGSSPDAIAGAAVDHLEEWHGRKLREAQAAVGE